VGLSRSRTLYFILLLALIVYSMRPTPDVDRFADALFLPSRWLGVLAAPLRWLSARDAHAAETAIAERVASEIEQSRALLAAERSSARPTEQSLGVDRGFVHAEVRRHVDKHPDQIEIAFNPSAHIERGMPVVCGDAYVGRVQSVVDASAGVAIVALVTGASFRVGARVDVPGDGAGDGAGPHSAELVVGGLIARRAGANEPLRLTAQFPSERVTSAGTVRVDEPDALNAEPYRKLANGYLLGELEMIERRGEREAAVVPALDYWSGLYQVVVLVPDPSLHDVVLARDPFDEAAWIDVALAVDGNPSFWRAGRELAAGSSQGVGLDAGVAIGTRLVGRVVHVAPGSSDASWLADVGFSVNALATIEGVERPVVIGRLTSLGVDRASGDVLFRAVSRPFFASSPSEHGAHATLFTGSGDPGIPAGLWIGTTELPKGDAAASRSAPSITLRVHADQLARRWLRVSVWRTGSVTAGAGERP
jgi:hypothetical protein